jgi:hypothetical protein
MRAHTATGLIGPPQWSTLRCDWVLTHRPPVVSRSSENRCDNRAIGREPLLSHHYSQTKDTGGKEIYLAVSALHHTRTVTIKRQQAIRSWSAGRNWILSTRWGSETTHLCTKTFTSSHSQYHLTNAKMGSDAVASNATGISSTRYGQYTNALHQPRLFSSAYPALFDELVLNTCKKGPEASLRTPSHLSFQTSR